MEEIRYNRHNHTHYSDGRLSPADVVRANKQKGYNCIALTDHFSVDGIDEAIEEGTKLGVTVFPGIELETKKVELLGLFIDHKNPQLRAFLQQLRQYHDAVLRETIEHLNKNGIRVSVEEIRRFAGCRAIFNENIIDFLVQKRFAANKRRAKKMLVAVPLNRIKKFSQKRFIRQQLKQRQK
ncbi:MAG: PHP domain-containing protein [archaeon]